MLDNRDQGRSGDADPHTEYAITDMAADTRGVLDDLTIDRAHFFGISVGGQLRRPTTGHTDRPASCDNCKPCAPTST
jgi:hypothetical protein